MVGVKEAVAQVKEAARLDKEAGALGLEAQHRGARHAKLSDAVRAYQRGAEMIGEVLDNSKNKPAVVETLSRKRDEVNERVQSLMRKLPDGKLVEVQGGGEDTFRLAVKLLKKGAAADRRVKEGDESQKSVAIDAYRQALARIEEAQPWAKDKEQAVATLKGKASGVRKRLANLQPGPASQPEPGPEPPPELPQPQPEPEPEPQPQPPPPLSQPELELEPDTPGGAESGAAVLGATMNSPGAREAASTVDARAQAQAQAAQRSADRRKQQQPPPPQTPLQGTAIGSPAKRSEAAAGGAGPGAGGSPAGAGSSASRRWCRRCQAAFAGPMCAGEHPNFMYRRRRRHLLLLLLLLRCTILTAWAA
jgi:hypothetical protein